MLVQETGQTQPLALPVQNEIIEQFHRDGFALVPGVLSAEECTALRQRTDEIFDDPAAARNGAYSQFALGNVIAHNRLFCDLFAREPILSLVQAIVGDDCRVCGFGILRTQAGQGVTFWHLDDANVVDFPLPDSVARHDPRLQMPVFWLSVQVPLTDIESPEYGPTEVVRGSHYSGRKPDKENLEFEGNGPEPVLCRAGDIYLFNHQVWHRGAPNASDRTRYLLQLQYAQGVRVNRFAGLGNTPGLDETLAGADTTLLKLFGKA